MNVGAALPSSRQPAERGELGEAAFDLPPVPAEPLRALDLPSGDAGDHAPAPHRFPAARLVVAFVGVDLGPSAQPVPGGVEQGRKPMLVMDVGRPYERVS